MRTRPVRPCASACSSAGMPASDAEERLHALRQEAAGGGQLHPPAGAHEQRGSERGFKLGDLAAQRGLGDGQRLGRLPEMKLARHLAEIDQVPQLEIELILPEASQTTKQVFPGIARME